MKADEGSFDAGDEEPEGRAATGGHGHAGTGDGIGRGSDHDHATGEDGWHLPSPAAPTPASDHPLARPDPSSTERARRDRRHAGRTGNQETGERPGSGERTENDDNHLAGDVSRDVPREQESPAHAAARNGVRRWFGRSSARSGLRRLGPPAIAATLTACALAPVAAPALGLAGGAVAGALVDLLGGLGSDYLSDLVSGVRERAEKAARGADSDEDAPESERKPTTADGGATAVDPDLLRELLAVELERRLAVGGEEAAALRREMAAVLRSVDAVGVALEAAVRAEARETRQDVVAALLSLGAEFREFHWMISGAREALLDMQRQLTDQTSAQRRHILLTERSLYELTALRAELAGAPTPAEEGEHPPAPVHDRSSRDACPPEPCPYPGLAPFEAHDARWFFGRERLTAMLVGRLAATADNGGPVLVLGPSGSGKSSLIRAGLARAVARGDLPFPGSRRWRPRLVRPGADPVLRLAEQLTSAAAGSDSPGLDWPVTRIRRRLGEEPGSVRRALDATTSDGTGRVLLVVDQAEELFTQANAVDRARFLDALAALTEAHDGGGGAPVLAVVGLRADHVRRCVDHPLLLTALERTTLAVEPMRPAELARSVLGPAEAVGLRVEPGLVDLLLADLGTAHRSGEPGTLPHLGHALRETWRRREGNTLTVAGYRDAGGVSGAISGAAESCYQRLSPDQRRLVRRLFTELVTVSGDAEPHRRRRGRAELVEAWEPSGSWDPEVLDGLVEARLVTVGEDSVEISHEVLPRSWDRLRAWLAEDREELVLRGRLSVAARDWDGGGRPPDSLWRGTQLAVVRAWVGERPRSRLPGRRLRGRRSTEDSSPPSPVGLPPVEADFVRASVRLDRRRDRATVGVVVGLVALLVAALTGAGVAVVQLRTSTVLAAEALSRQYAAQAALDEATQQRRAQLGALAAWRASPTVEARSALFSQVLNPLRGPLTGQGAAVSDVAVTDDGTVAATADGGGEVVLWNVADRTERTRLRVTDSGVYRVVLSPDGDQVVTTDLDPGGGLAAWDAAGGNPRWRGGPGTSELAYRPSGDLLASADADNVVRLRDPATGQVVDEATAHEDLVTGMAFSMDGSRLATGDLVGEIVVRDLPGSRELVRVRPTGAAISGVSLNEDGTRLVTTSLTGWSGTGTSTPVSNCSHGTTRRIPRPLSATCRETGSWSPGT